MEIPVSPAPPVPLVPPVPLIIFDLDGTLILRRDKNVILRKGASELIEFVLSEYQGAVFTSITKTNLNTLISKVFTDKNLVRLRFIWDRNFTNVDPECINK